MGFGYYDDGDLPVYGFVDEEPSDDMVVNLEGEVEIFNGDLRWHKAAFGRVDDGMYQLFFEREATLDEVVEECMIAVSEKDDSFVRNTDAEDRFDEAIGVYFGEDDYTDYDGYDYDEYGYDDAYESFDDYDDDSEEKVRSICLEIADELYNFEVAKILEWCDEVSYSYELEETVSASW